MSIESDFTSAPLASVLVKMGRTTVLCTVSSEASVPRFLKGRGQGWITAEYSMLPGSTESRNEREASRGRVKGRTSEIQRLIGRSLRAVIDMSALGERSLWVDCDVLQADGGTRCASITGGYVALAIALGRMLRSGVLERDPLRDSVAAVSVGIIGGEVMLDLPYEEDSRAEVDMNVIATGAGRFVEVQGTGEEGTFSPDELSQLTQLALAGIEELTQLQRRTIAAALEAS